MAHAKVSDEVVMGELIRVFRKHGYEGASLNRLAAATGLEKASLYHRFPGGKDDMVKAVIESVGQWFQEHVFDPLRSEGTPAERARLVARSLGKFYGNGRESCVLDTLSLPAGNEALRAALRGALSLWLEAFGSVARASGFSAAESRHRAQTAIVEIEGSLVVSRVLGKTTVFQRTLKRLPLLLTGDQELA